MHSPIRYALGLFSLVLIGTTRVAAQVPADQAATVVAAALSAVRSQAGDMAALVEIADTLGISPAHAADAIAHAGAAAARLADVRKCSGDGPAGCRLVGTRTFLRITRVAGDAKTAQIDVEILRQTASKRQPVSGEGVTVTVANEGGHWRVTQVSSSFSS